MAKIKVKKKKIKIFLSCPLGTQEEVRLYINFRKALEDHGLEVCTIGVDVKPKSEKEISELEREHIGNSDALLAIVARKKAVGWAPFPYVPCLVPSGYDYSYSVNEEINYAYEFKEPIYLFIEKGVSPEGGIKEKAKHWREFDRDNVFQRESIISMKEWFKKTFGIEIPFKDEVSEMMGKIKRDIQGQLQSGL